MLHDALELCTDGPAAIRYARGAARQVDEHEVGSGLSARQVRDGAGDVCLIAVGKLVGAAEKAAEVLAAEGVEITVWDPRVVKPLDEVMLADAARHRIVIVAEDGLRDGGVGMMAACAIAAQCDGRAAPRFVLLGVPTQFVPHGKQDRILARLGLDADGLVRSVREALDR
jgi:1-deoxy-D-xylulose-5-phosphate synthase